MEAPIEESMLAGYHRQAADAKELRGLLVEFAKNIRECHTILQKSDEHMALAKQSSSLSEAARVAESAIVSLDRYLAQPMPLPWDIRLSEAAPLGRA